MLLNKHKEKTMPFATDEEIRIAHDVLLKGKKPFDNTRGSIIKEDSSCYVQACPGSGKTTTLLAKLIILANKMPLPEGKGVCVLTHTNVAIDEIKAKLGQKAEVLFKYPNFFGTIQSFLHKYVAAAALHYFYGSQINYVDDDVAKAVFIRKFGNLVFGNKLRNLIYARTLAKDYEIKEEEINTLGGKDLLTAAKVIKKKGPRSTKYIFMLKGYDLQNVPNSLKSLIRIKKNGILDNIGREIILSSSIDWNNNQIVIDSRPIGMDSESGQEYMRIKEEMFREGILSFDDAYDLAFRYIREKDLDFSCISDKRFKYLFVDEVQDCDKKQIDLIRSLFADDKVVVQRFGDYCQAIFDGEENGGVEIEELKGDNAYYIHDSYRFGERIAKPLRSLCVEDNHLLSGNYDIHSVKPIIITYEDPLSVLPKYVELLGSTRIPEMDNLSVLEIANKEKREDPLHRVNVKACGWVGKRVANEQNRFIESYFPFFERKKNGTRTESASFIDFIPNNPRGTTKDNASLIIQGIIKFLDLCDVKNGDRRYNRTTLLAYLASINEEEKGVFLSKVMNWAMFAVTSSDENDVLALKESLYRYLTESLLPLFGKEATYAANTFFNATSGNHDNTAKEQGNIYHGDGIDIEVATVHAVKGETHASTLYLETSYYGHHESEYLSEQFKGVFYSGTDEKMLRVLRVVYVGMSRPRYLLCVAIQKDRFDQIDCDALRKIWAVQSAENHWARKGDERP